MSSDPLRILADAIPTLAWTARADGFIDWYNARWYEYTGTTAAEMEGWNWQSVHDPAVLPEVLEEWTKSIRTGAPFEMTFPLKGADGQFRQFLTRVVPVRDGGGRVDRWFGTNTDVDAERRARDAAEYSRAELSRVFMQAPVAISLVRGPRHLFEIANPLYLDVVGRTDIIGLSVREAFPDLAGQGLFELLDQVYASGIPYVGNETRVALARGPGGASSDGYFNFVFQPVVDVDGQVDGIAIVATEVTKHVEARLEADRLRGVAEAANRAKAEFLANMSHELRTPLNAIGGYADLLELGVRGQLTPDQASDVARIRVSQRHLLSLVNEVLNFARLEAGRVEINVTAWSVAELLAEVVPLVAPQIAARQIQFSSDPGTAGIAIRADREKTRQVLLNLLSNAIKFTAPEGTITMFAAAEPSTVSITVRDSGVGIPAERLKDIFDPFVQVTRSLSQPTEGTGLGLAISRDLALAMDGELTVESAAGRGSDFMLRLPRAPGPDAEAETRRDISGAA